MDILLQLEFCKKHLIDDDDDDDDDDDGVACFQAV